MEVLELAQSLASTVHGPAREELAEFISSLQTTNIFLGTTLVEVLMAYGLVTSPVSPEEAREQVDQVLTAAEGTAPRELAYKIVSNIFEDIFQGAYWDAIEELTPPDRIRLLVQAALWGPFTAVRLIGSSEN